MTTLADIALPFVDMAHRIVWATVATTQPDGEPRTRILHPLWEWDGSELTGWIATAPTAIKRAALDANPRVSLTYWDPSHDTCTADCGAAWAFDDAACTELWEKLKAAPPPVGYDPAIIPVWKDGPTSPAFAALRLMPYRLRVMPAAVMLKGEGETLTWTR